MISEAIHHGFTNSSVSRLRFFPLTCYSYTVHYRKLLKTMEWELIFTFLDIIFRIIMPLCGLIGNTLVILTVVQGYVQLTTAHCMIASLALSNFLYALQYVIFTPFALIYGRYVLSFVFSCFGKKGCDPSSPLTASHGGHRIFHRAQTTFHQFKIKTDSLAEGGGLLGLGHPQLNPPIVSTQKGGPGLCVSV